MPLASHGSIAESEKRIRDMRRASSSGLGDEKPWAKAQASKEKAEIAALQHDNAVLASENRVLANARNLSEALEACDSGETTALMQVAFLLEQTELLSFAQGSQ